LVQKGSPDLSKSIISINKLILDMNKDYSTPIAHPQQLYIATKVLINIAKIIWYRDVNNIKIAASATNSSSTSSSATNSASSSESTNVTTSTSSSASASASDSESTNATTSTTASTSASTSAASASSSAAVIYPLHYQGSINYENSCYVEGFAEIIMPFLGRHADLWSGISNYVTGGLAALHQCMQKRGEGDFITALSLVMKWVCDPDNKMYARNSFGNPATVLNNMLTEVVYLLSIDTYSYH
jgi:hypothetical protein